MKKRPVILDGKRLVIRLSDESGLTLPPDQTIEPNDYFNDRRHGRVYQVTAVTPEEITAREVEPTFQRPLDLAILTNPRLGDLREIDTEIIRRKER